MKINGSRHVIVCFCGEQKLDQLLNQSELENTIETTMQSIGDIFGFTVVHKNKQAYILENVY